MIEPESQYLYEKKIQDLEQKITDIKLLLQNILDGKTVMKQEVEKAVQDDF